MNPDWQSIAAALSTELANERESRERWRQWCLNAQDKLAGEQEKVKELEELWRNFEPPAQP
jgi:hypothetical protein